MKPVAIITGASAGIGTELARTFARNGHRLMLVARREDRLKQLAAEIAAAGLPAPHILPLDLGRADAAAQIGDALRARDLEPQYVVNNAGFGLLGEAASLDRNEQLSMIDLNIRTLNDLSLAFVESLARTRGGVLNVASVAGFLPGPGMAVYYASKAYVLSFSEALHREYKSIGVRVTCLCPGPVATEFSTRAGSVKDGASDVLATSAGQVAEEGYRGLMQGRRVVIPGFGNKIAAFVTRITPRALQLEVLAARQKRRAASPAPRT